MGEGKRTRLIILLLAVFLGVGLTSIPVLGISAAPSGTITVCQAGPPQCDYQTIQAGIDAAGVGDTILISAGTYSERLTLKSGVTVQSEHGPETVTVTASSQPIVSASGVVSVVIQGISVVGQGAVSPAVGIEVASSEVTVFDCVVRNVHGANGDEAHHDGWDATAIRSTGSVMTITMSTIQDLLGGDGEWYSEGADGGDAVGIWASGGGRVFVLETAIYRLEGGDAYFGDQEGASGGRSIGIHTEGGVDLVADGSEFVELRGGEPSIPPSSCSLFVYAGASIGVQAVGGTVVLRDNLFEDIWQRAAHGSEPGCAVCTSNTSVTHLERNMITSLWAELPPNREARASKSDVFSKAPLVPYCPIEEGSIVAIVSESDAVLRVRDNSLSDLRGVGQSGQAIGILARDVGSVVLVRNSVTRIVGSYSGDYGPKATAVGIRLERVSSAEIVANTLSEIRGADIPQGSVYHSLKGGGVSGIDLEGVQEAVVTNNTVWSLTGGQGAFGYWGFGDRGSDAIALRVVGGTVSVWNNVLYQTTAGIGGWDFDEEPGSAVGLYLGQDADVLAVNNAIISHTIGVSTTAQSVPILAYNALWDNETDYAGVPPGAGDLYVAPRFVNAKNGDFHLRSDSPLIDAGTNVGAPSEDFEGVPRPLDGNNDGYARADIGADEYWQGIVGFKKVQSAVAASGDVLTYQLVFSNASSHDPLNVTLTDTLPSKTAYVSGTLGATAGSWDYSDGVVTWTGSVTPGESVTLTFNVAVDGGLVGPHAVVNQADLDDHVGKMQVLEATALVNPVKYYLPIFLVE